MQYKEFYPFYTAYGTPGLYKGERTQEEEFARMKAYYPETARKIQEKVENACQLIDYEGSRLYDEYPDRLMLNRMADRIYTDMKQELAVQDISGGLLEDMVRVLLFQEISRRRCRRHRCRKYFYTM